MMGTEMIKVKDLPFTDKDLEALDEEDDSKYSDPLWEKAKRQRGEAISLEEYARQRGINK